MRIWTNTEFEGHYPVGTAAVVIAKSAEEAAEYLNSVLGDYGLKESAKPEQFCLVPFEEGITIVLHDGNY